jgi:tripartite-type tricarboxylate transporter receptor subunit TctC
MFKMIVDRRASRMALVAFLAGMAGLTFTTPSLAQTDYPRQPISFVVGASPGGPSDTITRLIADRLKPRLGADAVLTLDYKPGANGRIAGALVAKAAPDGYNLLSTAAGHSINPALYTNMPYDPLKDLTPVAFLAYSRTVMAVTREVPAKTLQELVASGKQNPLSYASGGSGAMSHLLAELLIGSAAAQGAQFLHVPYKSGTASVPDLISGRVIFLFDSVQQMAPLAQAGKLQIMAVTSDRRWPALPNVPTMKEAGFPEATASSWLAIFAPSKTPSAIMRKLNTEINAILATDEVRDNLLKQGFEHVPMSLEQANQFVLDEAARWAAVVKRAGIKPE